MTEMNHNPLGAALGTGGTAPRNGFDQGEHGAGIGLSGGADAPNAHNSLSGGAGGAHSHPIADKYMGQGASAAGAVGPGYGFTGASGGKLDNSLDNYTEGAGQRQPEIGSGYGGGEDPLSGNSGQGRTSAATGAGLAGVGAGAGAGALAGSGSRDATSGAYEGVGGGDALTGQANARSTGEGVGFGGENLSGAGAGAAGVGAGAGAATGASSSGEGNTALSKAHYGTVDTDSSRGAPVANPADIDSGGRHGLVYDEKTGTYEHRHVLKEGEHRH